MIRTLTVEVEITVIVDGHRRSSAKSFRDVVVGSRPRHIVDDVAMAMVMASHKTVIPALNAFKNKFGEELEGKK